MQSKVGAFLQPQFLPPPPAPEGENRIQSADIFPLGSTAESRGRESQIQDSEKEIDSLFALCPLCSVNKKEGGGRISSTHKKEYERKNFSLPCLSVGYSRSAIHKNEPDAARNMYDEAVGESSVHERCLIPTGGDARARESAELLALLSKFYLYTYKSEVMDLMQFPSREWLHRCRI